MSWRQFFDVLGLPIREWNDTWPAEPRPEDQLALAKKKFSRIYATLVRRRRAIEWLRQEIDDDERRISRQGNEEIWRRLELNRRRLHRRELNYQFLLERMARTKRKLARLQLEMHAAKKQVVKMRTLVLSERET